MPSNYDYDLICIGSGPSGQRAAVQAAKVGKRVAVIEKRRCVGGSCLETGTIPSKTFREAVRAATRAQALDRLVGQGLGLAPANRPSIQYLLGRVGAVIDRETRVLQHQLQRNDVNIIMGKATLQSTHEIAIKTEHGSSTVTTEHILIAVGTRPAKPAGVPVDGKTIVVSDGLLQLKQLPRTIAVVGAGVIGLEYASMFAAIGCEVTVIDRRDRPLEFVDSEIVDELIHQLRNRDVTFRLGEAVEKLATVSDPKPQGVMTLESGKHVVADLVLFSVGRQGATDDLGLDSAGLQADDRGRLKVDKHFRTAVPHIYAAGDVIGFPSLAATSSEQGRLAACHMFDVECHAMAEHFPFGIYAIPELSLVGSTEQQLTAAKIPYETGVARFREIARGQILGDDTGLLKLLFHRETEKLLGVHIIGTGATELIHTGQAVLALDGGLDYFLKTVFNYPTLAECYKVAALDASNKLYRSRQIRRDGETP